MLHHIIMAFVVEDYGNGNIAEGEKSMEVAGPGRKTVRRTKLPAQRISATAGGH